jgi:hypothetical protein
MQERALAVIFFALLLAVHALNLDPCASLPAVVQSRSAPKTTVVSLAQAPTPALSTLLLLLVEILLNSSVLPVTTEAVLVRVLPRLTALLLVSSATPIAENVISLVRYVVYF